MTRPDNDRADNRMLLRASVNRIHGLARHMHRRMRYVEVEELISVGLLTLNDALDKYDPERGTFGRYLKRRAVWAMLGAAQRRKRAFDPNRGVPLGVARRYFYDRPRPIRVASSQEEMVLPSILECRGGRPPGWVTNAGDLNDAAIHDEESAEGQLIRREEHLTLRSVIARLPPRERTLITLHYFGGETFSAIARRMNLTRARVSQLHRRALRRCGRILGEQGLDHGELARA